MNYRAEIDGLRAICVCSVIFYHAHIPGFGGGFVGVDIFFVISGFLITSILLGDLAEDKFSILRFYERRARRILPAFLTVIACVFPFALMWMQPWQFQELARSAISALFFVSNVFFWQTSNYFDAHIDEKPLLHTWSLAVEEQYYFIAPLVLFLLWRHARRHMLTVITIAALLSLALSEWAWRGHSTPNFYLLPTRAWEILIGAGCAMIRPPTGRWTELPALAGLVGVLLSVGLMNADIPVPSLRLLPVLAAAAAILVFAQRETLAARFLSFRPLVWIGLMSYSLYLWHQPVLAFARLRLAFSDQPSTVAILIALTFLLAFLTYHFVETPFRTRRAGTDVIPVRRMAVILGTASVAICGVATFELYEISNGRFRLEKLPNQLAFIDYRKEVAAQEAMFTTPDHPSKIATSFSAERAGQQRMLIVGDSNAGNMFMALELNRSAFQGVEFRLAPYFGGCMVQKPPETAAWTDQCLHEHAAANGTLVDEATIVMFSMYWSKLDLEGLDEMLRAAVAHYQKLGKTVVLTSVTEIYRPSVPFLLNELYREGKLDKANADTLLYGARDSKSAQYDEILRKVAEETGAIYLRKADFICNDAEKRCEALTDDGAAIYLDEHHYTLAGEKYFGEIISKIGWLDPVLKKTTR